MVSVSLPETIDLQLEKLCSATRRTKSFYILEALSLYLDDIEDNYIVLERINNPERKLYSNAQVAEMLMDYDAKQ